MSTPAPGNQQYDLGEAINKLSEGQKVFGGRYTLMKIVGRSLLSVAWLAWDEKQNRDVALKFLPVMVKEDASALANLKREVKKLQEEVKGPQLVAIYDVEVDGLVVALATEYVEGASLAVIRDQKKNKCFAPQELADTLQQLCTVLEQTFNETQILHGNIKPTNLLVNQKGQLKIADYGLDAILMDFISRTSEIKVGPRNLSYISPQKAGGAAHTVADEIYELGATIYELLTSRPPFYTGDLALQVNQKVPPPMVHRRKELRVIGEPIPRVWEETIAACLAKDPSHRPASISKLVEGLELEAPPSAEIQEPIVANQAQQQGTNNKTIFVAAAVIILLGAIAGILVGKNKKKTDEASGKPVQQVVDNSQQKKFEEESQRIQKELETKKKQADELQKKLDAEAKAMKEQQAKQAAEAEKARLEAEKKKKAAEDELKRLQAEADALKKKSASEATEASKKAEAESAAKLKAAQEQAQKMLAEAERLKAEQAKQLAEAMKKTEDTEAKRKAAEAESKRMAQLAEENRLRQIAMVAEAAKREAEAKALAEQKAKEDAARAEADKKAAAAALAARRYAAGKPWFNSLGIKLVPVGQNSVAVWECRYSDFEAFIKETKYAAGTGWRSAGFKQDESHPVVNVNYDDAQAFCKWLTEKETKETLISGYRYRLLTDQEWSAAAMLSGESGATPMDRDRKIIGVYPWGAAWPPPAGAGNYENRLAYDRFENTAPVASFLPNANGIYDLGGNVWELCEDSADGSQKSRVARGGSWNGYDASQLLTSARIVVGQTERKNDVGFRIALVPAK